jgi:hypothetical protein
MSDPFNLTRKDWVARPAVIIASGPSLTAADCELVRQARAADQVRVISVSNAWKHTGPWADRFFAADQRYWRAYIGGMLAAGATRDRMITCDNVAAMQHNISRVRAANRPSIGLREMHTGGNSGFMGMNLAFLYGARRILLLGFDMQEGPAGEKHFDGAHPKPLVQAMPFKEWVSRFEKAVPTLIEHKCQVINCTRRTALQCFTKGALEAELPPIH